MFGEKNHVVPTAWQEEALARYGVSREVPCSALKGETVPDSLRATPKSPPTYTNGFLTFLRNLFLEGLKHLVPLTVGRL